MRAKKPAFKRQHNEKKRVSKKGWRAPRGIDSRQQKHKKDRGAIPKVGYGSPKASKGTHPSGTKEMLVRSSADLSKVTGKMAARLSSALGKKKREALLKEAEEKKIRVLN